MKNGYNCVGNRIRVKVTRNTVAPPFRDTELDLFYGRGISLAGDVLDLAVAGRIATKGRKYMFKKTTLGQSRFDAICYLEEHPEVLEELHEAVMPKQEEQADEKHEKTSD